MEEKSGDKHSQLAGSRSRRRDWDLPVVIVGQSLQNGKFSICIYLVSCVDFRANCCKIVLNSCFIQAGAMDRAKNSKKIADEENEERFGYVHGVSGPGE